MLELDGVSHGQAEGFRGFRMQCYLASLRRKLAFHDYGYIDALPEGLHLHHMLAVVLFKRLEGLALGLDLGNAFRFGELLKVGVR